MIQLKTTTQRAFSLLEITFVMLLLGIVIVSTSLYVKNTNEKAAAKKVAENINYWLNAAVNYYSTQKVWPDTLDEIANSVGVSASDHDHYLFLPGNNYGKGAGIKVVGLPSEHFAQLVKAQLSRAVLDGNTIYAYTPAVSTLLPTETIVKGVGYVRFYNCHSSDVSTDPNRSCDSYGSTMCEDPGNMRGYDPVQHQSGKSNPYGKPYEFRSYEFVFEPNQIGHSTAGECIIPAPECEGDSIPQIFYALAQFRAPFNPPYAGTNSTPSHFNRDHYKYQSYLSQVQIICQASPDVPFSGDNLGPCGPNTLFVSKDHYKLKYWTLSAYMKSSNQYNGTTRDTAWFGENQSATNVSGNYYAQSSSQWSAVASYIIACVPKSQIINAVSGGDIYRITGPYIYSQDMMSE